MQKRIQVRQRDNFLRQRAIGLTFRNASYNSLQVLKGLNKDKKGENSKHD